MIRKALLIAALPLVACNPAPAQVETSPADRIELLPTPAEPGDAGAPAPTSLMGASIVGADGEKIGNLTLQTGPNGVLIEAVIVPNGLTPGWHGLHLHQVGDCSDIGAFKLSGGHLGMVMGGHGLLNPAGPEAGDLPNIWAASDGSAGYEAFSTLFSLAEIADADGAALIIHESRDDHISQPIGGAGGRVACAAIR